MKNFLKKVESYLLNLDMYGHRVDLYIDSKTFVKSKIGALFSVLVVLFCIYSFIGNYLSWANKEYLQTISSSTSLNVNQILRENKAYNFSLDSNNYGMYFILRGRLNKTYVPSSNLTRYLTQTFYFYDEKGQENKLEMENCLTRKINNFLLQDNQNLKSINESSPWRICIKDGQGVYLGLIPDSKMVQTPALMFQINKCINSTQNNYSCAASEEINEVINTLEFQTSIPRTIFDFNDVENPRQRTYDYRLYSLDIQFCKKFLSYLMPIYLKTDEGILFDDYKLNSIDFNVDDMQYESLNRIGQDGLILSYEFIFGLNQQIYYRKNLKLYHIVANLGGIINILFILGRIICYSYNMLILKFSLMNISFSNLDTYNNLYDSQGTHSEDKNFKFSFFSLIFPSLSKNKIYSEALNNIYEYMDIKNIIKRLQDIDKFKLILFDENQRKVFETLPKPGIGVRKNILQNSFLTMESIKKSKKQGYQRKSVHKLGFLLNGDPINQRMYDMLDPQLKKDCEEIGFSIKFFLDILSFLILLKEQNVSNNSPFKPFKTNPLNFSLNNEEIQSSRPLTQKISVRNLKPVNSEAEIPQEKSENVEMKIFKTISKS